MRRALGILAMFTAAAAIGVGVHLAIAGRPSLTLHLAGRSLQLLAPHRLTLLALLPYLVMVQSASLSDLARGQRWLGLFVRALFVTTLVGALARPAIVRERQAVSTVALVDVSDSVSDAELEEARRFVEALRAGVRERRAHGDEDELALVSFAARPRVIALPEGDTPLPPLARPSSVAGDGAATDLQAAVRLAAGLFAPATIHRAVLLTDGNQTTGDLLAEAATLRARDLRLDVRPYGALHADEVLVQALRVPPSVRLGQPFVVEAEVYASRAVTARATLLQDGVVTARDGQRSVTLAPGRNRLRFFVEVSEPGFVTYQLRVGGLPSEFHDRFADNNQATASVAVRGKPRILYVEGEPSSARYLQAALARESLDVEVRGPGGLPSTARELGRFDLVIVSDLPQSAFGLAQMAAVESYVRDGGGGFLMAGGEGSFGSGGYAGTRIERLLPVRFDGEKKREEPSLALVLAIDRSGSMQGEKLELAKDAARASAELLGGEDLVGVIAFDSQAQPVVRLQRASNRLRIVSDIARITSGGGTNLLAPLQEAYEELAPARARVKHVILLTDGQASYDGIAELVARMVEAHVTVSAVGVGEGADKTLLKMIAERGGGRFYFTSDPSSVPRIFTRETTEVARSALVEEPVRARALKRADVLEGIAFDGPAGAPPLRGYVTTRPRPLSEVLLVAEPSGDPLLVRWRVGLGQAAVWTSDVKNRWAVDWLRWPGYTKLFAQLARSLMRHRALAAPTEGYTLTTEVDPPTVHATIDAIAPDDRFVNDLQSSLEIAPAAEPRNTRVVTLRQTAAGRYEGQFRMDRWGSYLLRAIHTRAGRTVGETSGAVSVPYPPEYLALPPDEAILEAAATAAGGLVRPSVSQILDPGSTKLEWPEEQWRALLLAAVALLLLDVAVRRVRLFGYRR